MILAEADFQCLIKILISLSFRCFIRVLMICQAALKVTIKHKKHSCKTPLHELRTPLMSIQGYAEGITNGVLHDTNSAAKIITSESKRLSTLVDELLTLSRIDCL